MAFELPALSYAESALAERGMCQETLELHHGKHHNAYVTALNGFVEKNADLQGKSLEEIIAFVKDKPDMAPVFNNAGQHWNHIHFWNALSSRISARSTPSRMPSRPPLSASSAPAGPGWFRATTAS